MINHTMEIEISKMGERGQVVIPLDIRQKFNIKTGEKFLVIVENDNIILRPMKKIKSLDLIHEDILDMQIAEKRWNEIEQGKAIIKTKEEFLKEMEKW